MMEGEGYSDVQRVAPPAKSQLKCLQWTPNKQGVSKTRLEGGGCNHVAVPMYKEGNLSD